MLTKALVILTEFLIFAVEKRANNSISKVMIINFNVENYRSIDRQVLLCLECTGGMKDLRNVGFTERGINKYLNTIAIYGANSSGKSNFLRAIYTMKHMVTHSVRLNETDSLPYDPFVLKEDNDKPTLFEITFEDEKGSYSYGFKYDQNTIIEEWLSAKFPKKSRKELFTRVGETFSRDEKSFPESDIIVNKTLKLNKNRLAISLMGQAGGEISNTVINWFSDHINVISGLNDGNYAKLTKHLIHENSELKEGILKFIYSMNLGFSGIQTRQISVEEINLPPGIPTEILNKLKADPYIEVSAIHNVYNDQNEIIDSIKFNFGETESAGSNKIFNIAGPIVKALYYGKVLVIDELDSQMHPLLSQRIIDIFNSPEFNPHGAQLIFTTHDTHLLSNKIMRRDQIWFTEKDEHEATKIYPMKDISLDSNHKPRKDSNYEKNYLAGKYGAIPFMEGPDKKQLGLE